VNGTRLLEVRNLVKEFTVRRTSWRGTSGLVHAVSGVSFDIHRGEALSVVGESGCGKSTTARCVTLLDRPTSGSVQLDGVELTTLPRNELREARRRFQMVFQDPQASLNPRMTVGEIIGEPLLVHGVDAVERDRRVDELLDLVQLGTGAAVRHPHQFSGGQRQRIGIARALALEPDLVVLDEPVSALDVSIQAEIIRLLQRLRDELGLAYLFIAHDLSVVRHLSDRVAVMYLGKIVETAACADLFHSPAHPYTAALLSAAPIPDPLVERDRERIVLAGDPPTPTNPPSGCRFRTRCWRADELCAQVEPPLREIAGGHEVACHHDLWATPEHSVTGGVVSENSQSSVAGGAVDRFA
jgi:oligopeptide/dipeptide ABC transporter ATP-binding protein